ncbi:alpha/beta fold hydrolase [Synechococcus sp. PCC 7336]|uniref:alpha/beta fold hydrolase n=1 Tax=Synechococcus sp. PCC 7336 TaxID=195250 RepID=UPI0003456737|nr:alpha/beta hydrolase [Synechococcus sp. PCC 7336]
MPQVRQQISSFQLPALAQHLTETTSLALARSIEQLELPTALLPEPIPTTFVRRGRGPLPILLLHGFDSSVFEFRRLLPLLADRTQVWAVDLLGFGFTDRPQSLAFTPQEILTHLYHFWQEAIGQPMVLVGASMGGAAAIDFALTYPDSVQQLVLLDSAGFAKGGSEAKLMVPPLDWLASEVLRNGWVRDRISKLAYHDRAFASRDAAICAALHLECEGWRRATIAFAKSRGYTFLADRIAQLEPETLIIWGENDRILGRQDAAKFEQAIANSNLQWIPDCGHVPHLEKSQETAESILAFAGLAD